MIFIGWTALDIIFLLFIGSVSVRCLSVSIKQGSCALAWPAFVWQYPAPGGLHRCGLYGIAYQDIACMGVPCVGTAQGRTNCRLIPKTPDYQLGWAVLAASRLMDTLKRNFNLIHVENSPSLPCNIGLKNKVAEEMGP